MVYPGHPYSRPDEGHLKTVKSIKVNDLKSFHKKHYGPRGMVISIVGGIAPQDAVDKVRKALGDWENPEQPPVPDLPAWEPLIEMRSERVEIPGKSQSEVIVGTAGPTRSSLDYIPAALGNNIFGQFGLMGRIGEVVREKSGLAYYAYSSLGGSPGPGPWTVTAGVNPKDEEKAVALVLVEIRRFVTEPVTEEELSDTQANFIGRMPLALESNGGVATSMLHIEKHQLGLDYYRKYPDMIQAVTRENILTAASRYLDPDRLAVAIAGPPRE
jgi:zinc protease